MPILNDATFENSEAFTVVLSAAVNATIADATGVGTIRDDGTGLGGTDNDIPTLSVSNPVVTEGTNPFAVFTVSLSNPSTTDVTFDLALANGTATGGGVDFGPGLEVSTDGGTTWTPATSATIAAGTTSVLVRTPITNDLLDEAPETFTLTATRTAGTTSNPSAVGTATITDNDAPPSLSINDVTVNEGAGTATFTVTLSAASGQTVTVNYATSNGTATRRRGLHERDRDAEFCGRRDEPDDHRADRERRDVRAERELQRHAERAGQCDDRGRDSAWGRSSTTAPARAAPTTTGRASMFRT